MNIIPASYSIEPAIVDGMQILRAIELAGRTCYKSNGFCVGDWDKERTVKFVENLILRGHESVLEHEKMTIRFVCDRGVSHELVRHRIASFSQESTRYCNYTQNKFGNELTFIAPSFWLLGGQQRNRWEAAMHAAETSYFDLVQGGAKPEEARSVLPNSLKTEIVVTANMREWRHILKLRTAKVAHPQMRELMIPLLKELQSKIPALFDDIKVEE